MIKYISNAQNLTHGKHIRNVSFALVCTFALLLLLVLTIVLVVVVVLRNFLFVLASIIFETKFQDDLQPLCRINFPSFGVTVIAGFIFTNIFPSSLDYWFFSQSVSYELGLCLVTSKRMPGCQHLKDTKLCSLHPTRCAEVCRTGRCCRSMTSSSVSQTPACLLSQFLLVVFNQMVSRWLLHPWALQEDWGRMKSRL